MTLVSDFIIGHGMIIQEGQVFEAHLYNELRTFIQKLASFLLQSL